MASKTGPSLSQIYYIVLPLIRRAGQMLVSRQKSLATTKVAERHDRGNEIEAEISAFLLTTLNRLFPNHTVLGQEREAEGESEASYEWIVQPLDGRRYYYRGLPLYTTSIALRKNGEIVLGIVFEPITDTVYHAMRGDGAFMGNGSIQVSDQKDWADAAVYLESPMGENKQDQKNRSAVWQAFADVRCRIYDLGVPSLGLCYVAVGAFDVLVGGLEHEAFASDYAASLLIAEEAGATVTDLEGKKLPTSRMPSLVVVAAPSIHKQAMSLLPKAK